MQRTELKALTSLRGIAAMAVVLQHFSATAAWLCTGWLPSLVPHGYMAVDFFFVLSGFIMAYTYLAAFEARGIGEYSPFLYKRIARIFPLGVAVTLLILLCAALASLWHRADLFIPAPALEADPALVTLVNLLNLQGFLPRYLLNAPSWSVSLEFAAYLLFPLLIRLFFSPRVLPTALAAAACLVALVLVECVGPNTVGDGAILWNLARCLAEFGLGLLAFRAYRSSPTLRQLGQDRCTIAACLLTTVCGLLRLDLLTALSFPPLVLACALNRGRPARLLSARPLHALGVISFSVYLTHNILRGPLAAAFRALHPDKLDPAQALLFAAAGSLLVLPLAALSYRLVEQPGRTALNRLIRLLTPARLHPVGAD